jgi:hypothetical protein
LACNRCSAAPLVLNVFEIPISEYQIPNGS